MKIIDRYISRQLAITTFLGVTSLSTVLVVGNILRRILDLLVNRDLPLALVLKFVAYLMPFSLTFTIPWGFLTAVLLVFGRLSAENELTALRSTGWSPRRVALPVILAAVALSGLCFWLNGYIAPLANRELVRLPYDLATKTPDVLFESDSVIREFPGRRIFVGKKLEDGTLENLTVFEIDDNREPVRIIFARQGRLEPDAEKGQLLLLLRQTEIEEWPEPGNPRTVRAGITIQDADLEIPLQELREKTERRGGISTLDMNGLAALRADPAAENPTAVRTEIHRRWSISLACVAFALVGVPLGITAQRRETSIGFAFSLAVAFAYFLLVILADNFKGNPAFHPHLLAWMSNAVFLTLGAVLFWRLGRR